MKRWWIVIGTIVLSTTMWAVTYTPQTVPNPKEKDRFCYVANPDEIVSDEAIDYLNRTGRLLEDSTDVELCVVALQSIGETDAFSFAYELFQRWGIGKKEKSTGVLVLLAVDSRDIRIMTGGGIEGVLTDAKCNRIIREDMSPDLKEGNYSSGLCKGALRIYELCTEGDAPAELRNAKVVIDRSQWSDETEENSWIYALIALGVISLSIVLFVLIQYKKCPRCGRRRLLLIKKQVIQQPTLSAEGIGVATYKCKHCGCEDSRTYSIPRVIPFIPMGGGGFRSGGGGGFSGGSFGGGGTFGGGAGGKF